MIKKLYLNSKEKTKAILYDIILPFHTRKEVEKRIKETENLLSTYGGISELNIIQRRHHASSKSFIGLQKLKEITKLTQELNVNLIIINSELKAKQLYAIEEYLERTKIKVDIWDRVDLIIKIFSQHAQTAEAKLQLELAKIKHFGPRIYGMGEELSQQGGGLRARGLGETNTEIMKRHINERKKLIKRKINKLQLSRESNRKRRTKNGFKSISIVGYTNAGKSCLFKSLTQKNVLVKDELFATLDTITGKVYLPDCSKNILISDTIGFISNLPADLLDAFKSTLEETIHADLLLHVIDISDIDFLKKINIVEDIICNHLNCSQTPTFYVFNKIDKFNEEELLKIKELIPLKYQENGIFISAKAKENLNLLKKSLSSFFFKVEIEAQKIKEKQWKN